MAKKAIVSRILGWGAIGFWLLMMGLLVRREGCMPSPVPYAEVTAPILPGPGEETWADEAWMGIYFQGQKVGWLHHVCEPWDDGYVVREESLTHLKMMNTPHTIRTETTCWTDKAFSLRSFTFRMRSAAVSLEVSGMVEGTVVRLEIRSDGSTRQEEIRLRRSPYLFLNLRPYLVREGLETGKSFRVPVVLPSTLSQADAVLTVEAEEEIRIHGESRQAFRIQVSYAGMEATSWYDPQGRVLKEVTPMGLTLVREPAGQAVSGLKTGGEAVDVTASTMIPVDRPLSDPAGLRMLRVSLQGIDPGALEIGGGRQRLQGSILEIVREDLDSLPEIRIPVGDKGLEAFLEATPFLQSDDERIQRQARKIVGQEKAAVEAARRLMEWVYGNLVKRPTVSLPSALQVLDGRAGDCNEHAVLMAALARAIGLPAREVVGVVYMDGGFFYHAWNEVWVGKWVSLDPVMGQFPADVTHVKFLEGGLEEQMRIAEVIGRLSMEILEAR